MKFKAEYIEVTVIKDDFNEGEVGKRWLLVDERLHDKAYDTIVHALIGAAEKVDHYVLSMADKSMWSYIPEDGRFVYSYQSDENGNELVIDKKELEQWKNGKLDVYSTMVDIKIVQINDLDENVANEQGFSE